MAKTALITGITGQDGSYLAELLLEKGYEVVGVVRRSSAPNHWRIEHLLDRITLRPADLLDQLSLIRVIDEVAARRALQPRGDVVRAGVVGPADADRRVQLAGRDARARGHPPGRPEDPLLPGVVERDVRQGARGAADRADAVLPAQPLRRRRRCSATTSPSTTARATACSPCSGILFNHESPRRGLEFVTRKVTDGVARIKLGLADTLRLGNLDAQRDWGFAGDYVRAMWLMLQQDTADDYVIATGESHSVQRLVELAFAHVGLDWQEHVKFDPRFMRPAEVDHLIGDPAKARRVLGWAARSRLRAAGRHDGRRRHRPAPRASRAC